MVEETAPRLSRNGRDYGECEVDYCDRPADYKGTALCTNHYARFKRGRAGWDQKSQAEKSERDRFWEKVNKEGPLPPGLMGEESCWVWTGGKSRTPGGQEYGAFRSKDLGGRTTRAHRVSYFWETGVASTRFQHLDHLCRNTLCVRPSHLELVTPRENALRGTGPTAVNSRKTHCLHGHKLEGSNLMERSGGGRKCRQCHRKVSLNWARREAEKRKS